MRETEKEKQIEMLEIEGDEREKRIKRERKILPTNKKENLLRECC